MNTERVPDHLVWAILSTLFCCLPFGIVSIVYACRVNGLVAMGNIPAAREASSNAKKWAIIAAAVTLAFVAFYLVIFMLGIIGGGLSASDL